MRCVLCAVLLLITACGAPDSRLAGTELGKGVAPDFTLQDALTGSSVSLSSLKGNVVMLTFLYTQCPDSCPLTAEFLRGSREKVGQDAVRVTLVAVSVDPARDTPQAVRSFSDAHRLSANWHYLIGRPEQLAPVWSAYGVRSAPDPGKPTVTHSDAIYLIDQQGRERSIFHTDEPMDSVVASLKVLLAGR